VIKSGLYLALDGSFVKKNYERNGEDGEKNEDGKMIKRVRGFKGSRVWSKERR